MLPLIWLFRRIVIAMIYIALTRSDTLITFKGILSRDMTVLPIYRNVTVRKCTECMHLCKLDEMCRHVNFNENNNVCGFIGSESPRGNLPTSSLFMPVQSQNIFVEIEPYVRASDCEGISQTSQGIYKIQPNASLEPFYARCENGWTVIQKRYDGSVDFNTSLWQDYKIGFGNLNGEFWLGLENMYLITNQANYTIQIEIGLYDGTHIVQNTYSGFRVSDEANWYQMLVNDSSPDPSYRFANYNEKYFSTRDHGTDINQINCAKKQHGGWWYKRCALFNMNSPRPSGANKCLGGTDMSVCMKMRTHEGINQPVISSVMKIRQEH